jgi:hypothetical protein
MGKYLPFLKAGRAPQISRQQSASHPAKEAVPLHAPEGTASRHSSPVAIDCKWGRLHDAHQDATEASVHLNIHAHQVPMFGSYPSARQFLSRLKAAASGVWPAHNSSKKEGPFLCSHILDIYLHCWQTM